MAYTFEQLERIAEYAEKSGLFAAGQSLTQSQALMRILRGVELGLSPTTALTGIWFSRGKLIVDAATTSILLHINGYRVIVETCTTQSCVMRLLLNGEQVGAAEFTLNEAKQAGLVKAGSAWTNYTADMLFARCTTRLARRYATHVFGGGAYTAEEMDSVSEETQAPSPAIPQMYKVQEGEAWSYAPKFETDGDKIVLQVDGVNQQISKIVQIDALCDDMLKKGMTEEEIKERFVATMQKCGVETEEDIPDEIFTQLQAQVYKWVGRTPKKEKEVIASTIEKIQEMQEEQNQVE